MLSRWRTEAYGRQSLSNIFHRYVPLYRLGSMQHADIEVPQKQAAVFTDTTETVIPVVATPRIKGDTSDPRVMTRAARNELTIR